MVHKVDLDKMQNLSKSLKKFGDGINGNITELVRHSNKVIDSIKLQYPEVGVKKAIKEIEDKIRDIQADSKTLCDHVWDNAKNLNAAFAMYKQRELEEEKLIEQCTITVFDPSVERITFSDTQSSKKLSTYNSQNKKVTLYNIYTGAKIEIDADETAAITNLLNNGHSYNCPKVALYNLYTGAKIEIDADETVAITNLLNNGYSYKYPEGAGNTVCPIWQKSDENYSMMIQISFVRIYNKMVCCK